ncbi:hypothetical protein P9112_004489 [Eukaryota sp. TZLM1-RC]
MMMQDFTLTTHSSYEISPTTSSRPVCCCSCNDDLVFVAFEDQTVSLYSADSFLTPSLTFKTPTPISQISAFSDGKTLVVITSEQCLCYWNIDSLSSSSIPYSAVLTPPVTADPEIRAVFVTHICPPSDHWLPECAVVSYSNGLVTFYSKDESNFEALTPLNAFLVLRLCPLVKKVGSVTKGVFDSFFKEISIKLIGGSLFFSGYVGISESVLLYKISPFKSIISNSELSVCWQSFDHSLCILNVLSKKVKELTSLLTLGQGNSDLDHVSLITCSNDCEPLITCISLSKCGQVNTIKELYLASVNQISNQMTSSQLVDAGNLLPNSFFLLSPSFVAFFSIPNSFLFNLVNFDTIHPIDHHNLMACYGLCLRFGLFLLVKPNLSAVSPLLATGLSVEIPESLYLLFNNERSELFSQVCDFFDKNLGEFDTFEIFSVPILKFLDVLLKFSKDDSLQDFEEFSTKVTTIICKYLNSNYLDETQQLSFSLILMELLNQKLEQLNLFEFIYHFIVNYPEIRVHNSVFLAEIITSLCNSLFSTMNYFCFKFNDQTKFVLNYFLHNSQFDHLYQSILFVSDLPKDLTLNLINVDNFEQLSTDHLISMFFLSINNNSGSDFLIPFFQDSKFNQQLFNKFANFYSNVTPIKKSFVSQLFLKELSPVFEKSNYSPGIGFLFSLCSNSNLDIESLDTPLAKLFKLHQIDSSLLMSDVFKIFESVLSSEFTVTLIHSISSNFPHPNIFKFDISLYICLFPFIKDFTQSDVVYLTSSLVDSGLVSDHVVLFFSCFIHSKHQKDTADLNLLSELPFDLLLDVLAILLPKSDIEFQQIVLESLASLLSSNQFSFVMARLRSIIDFRDVVSSNSVEFSTAISCAQLGSLNDLSSLLV